MMSADEARRLSSRYIDSSELAKESLLDYIESKVVQACKSGYTYVSVHIPAVSPLNRPIIQGCAVTANFVVSKNDMYCYLESHQPEILSILSNDLGYITSIEFPEGFNNDLLQLYDRNVAATITLKWA